MRENTVQQFISCITSYPVATMVNHRGICLNISPRTDSSKLSAENECYASSVKVRYDRSSQKNILRRLHDDLTLGGEGNINPSTRSSPPLLLWLVHGDKVMFCSIVQRRYGRIKKRKENDLKSKIVWDVN